MAAFDPVGAFECYQSDCRQCPLSTIADIRGSADNCRMRVTLPLLFSVIAGCSDVENTFQVEALDGQPEAAVLSLCGSETALRQEGRMFSGSRAIDCEGSGQIRLGYADGTTVECPIGYVTPGAEQRWRFEARNRQCQALGG